MATGGEGGADGIGSGAGHSDSHDIFVATHCLVKADDNNPPTTVITNTGADLASKLADKRYAILKTLYDTVSVTVKDTLCYQQLFISRLQSVTPMQDTTFNDTIVKTVYKDSVIRDSIYIYELKVLPDVVIKDVESDKVCYNTEYTWALPEGNRTIDGYTVAGVKTIYDTVRNSLDCDSIIYTLNLTVLPDVVIKDAESDKVCYNTEYTWALPEGNRTIDGYTVAGVKTIYDTVRNSLDCDSIIYTLNLTVWPDVVIKDVESDKVCYNTDYTWVLPEGNRTIAGYTEAGLKTIFDTVRNSLDCDSIIYTLNLTVLPDVDVKDAVSDKVCYNTEYTWVLPEGNRTIDGYTVAGVKTIYDTVRNSLDCDSIIYTLNLTVLPDVVIKDAESDKVCYNTEYTWVLPEGNRTIDGYTVAGVKTIYD
ncbi:MAG: hypothetical protein MJZ84_08840, partial [Paludibacteraceae bacterium]|nr:hypothetical protein [Paludibacteraceae bacterium]